MRQLITAINGKVDFSMLASSLKFSGFSCFKDEWVGFDEFKPITVIIGRNNTGKSHLLDLVELLTASRIDWKDYRIQGTGILDEPFLKQAFPLGTSGGRLRGDYWEAHGIKLIGTSIAWEIGQDSSKNKLEFLNQRSHPDENVEIARKDQILDHLPRIRCSISKKVFRRILADRDIIKEKAATDLSIASNGIGATNIIRRMITSSNYSEDLIQVTLLDSLAEIFGSDGDFKRIEIREHDESGPGLWEVFLGEPRKGLIPLSRSGSGLKTVILVLLNLIVMPVIENKPPEQMVFALEELENNLHPALLRRLFKYVADYALRERTHVFLTTHSSVALDFFSTLTDSQTIHVSHNGISAKSKTVSAHFDRVGLMNELGARPSDLLQANGVIWLEGPSDRLYVNRFIELYSDGQLREGRDYQCAYYGGSVLAKTEFCSPDESNEDLANLLRLNNNIAVVCDGDRTSASGDGSLIKNRVQRIKNEVDKIDRAFIWITDAKEIENYVPGEVWKEVYAHDSSVPDPGRYDKFPTQNIEPDGFLFRELNRKSFDKCEFASEALPHLTRANLDHQFEIKSTMERLVTLIRQWNA
jgi:hypothetical protein